MTKRREGNKRKRERKKERKREETDRTTRKEKKRDKRRKGGMLSFFDWFQFSTGFNFRLISFVEQFLY